MNLRAVIGKNKVMKTRWFCSEKEGSMDKKDEERFKSMMEQIKSGVSGDYRTDMNYLKDKMSENANEFYFYMRVLIECGRMMYERLPEDKKELFKEPEKAYKNHSEMLAEYGKLLENHEVDKALEMWPEIGDSHWLIWTSALCKSMGENFIS